MAMTIEQLEKLTRNEVPNDEFHGMLQDYQTGETLRPATLDEREQSLSAAENDGGVGAFRLGSRTVCVVD